MENPFFHRGPVRAREYFFGRTADMDKILRLVRRGQAVSIVGPRRIGKSSLLWQLCNPEVTASYDLPANYKFVYIDCQELTGDVKLPDVYQRLLEEVRWVAGVLPTEWPGASEPLNYLAFEKQIQEITRDGAKIVFIFDEFEVLASNENLDKAFFTQLRGLGQKGFVTYITASGETLGDLAFHDENVLTSPFFNIFSTRWLRLMSQEEAMALIEGVAATSRFSGFDDGDISFLLNLAGPYPFFLQLASYLLFEEKIEHPQSRPDYGRVSQLFNREARGHFEHTWRNLDENARHVLQRLCNGAKVIIPVDVRERLEQRCLLYEEHIFSHAFAEFVRRRAAKPPGRPTVDVAPPVTAVASPHIPPAPLHANQQQKNPALKIEGEIRPIHRAFARQILKDEELEVARFQMLSDGYANFGIYRLDVRPPDQQGFLLSRVLKFASAKDIRAEAENFEHLVKDRLKISFGRGDIKPWFPDYIEDLAPEEWENEVAATMYPYAQTVGNVVLNLQEVYWQWLSEYPAHNAAGQQDPIHKTLYWLFDALRNWQLKASLKRHIPRFTEEYDRLVRKLDKMEYAAVSLPELELEPGVRQRPRLFREQPEFIWRGKSYRNPLHWVNHTFGSAKEPAWLEPLAFTYRSGIVHGDLNFRNILVEKKDEDFTNIWLIDFSDTHEGHVLRDFGDLEADLKFVLTPVSEADFSPQTDKNPPILAFERALITPNQRPEIDLERTSLPDVCAQNHKLVLAWTYTRLIRQKARQNVIVNTDVRPYYLSLLHATLPALYYHQLNRWQHLYAFLSAALICEKIDQLTEGGTPYEF